MRQKFSWAWCFKLRINLQLIRRNIIWNLETFQFQLILPNSDRFRSKQWIKKRKNGRKWNRGYEQTKAMTNFKVFFIYKWENEITNSNSSYCLRIWLWISCFPSLPTLILLSSQKKSYHLCWHLTSFLLLLHNVWKKSCKIWFYEVEVINKVVRHGDGWSFPIVS